MNYVINLLNAYEEKGATEFLYELMRERSTEDDKNVNISHRRVPSFIEHADFVLSRHYRVWHIITAQGAVHPAPVWVGSLTITWRNEVGIVLKRSARGMGVGKQALNLLLQMHRPLAGIPSMRPETFVANINPKNERSIRLFTGLGFTHIQNTYALQPEGDNDGQERDSST